MAMLIITRWSIALKSHQISQEIPHEFHRNHHEITKVLGRRPASAPDRRIPSERSWAGFSMWPGVQRTQEKIVGEWMLIPLVGHFTGQMFTGFDPSPWLVLVFLMVYSGGVGLKQK